MSRRDKSIHEIVKQFFGIKESPPINFEKLKREPYIISLDVLKDISSENSLNHRLKSLKDLYEIVLNKTLESNAVEAIAKNIEDLLDRQNSSETRHIVLQFYTALIHGQLDQLEIMRSYFFRLILQHDIREDVSPRLDMLKHLSSNGKVISNFEEEIGPFLLNWFPEIISTGKTNDFLPFVANIIKYNAAYLDEGIIQGFIHYTYQLCNPIRNNDDIQESLNILDAVLCYSHLPADALQIFILTLCLIVNNETFTHSSLKVMRNLLGTNRGNACIFKLCDILQDQNNYKEIPLVRGAVFFIGSALWGCKEIPTLIHPVNSVLPSFLKVLESNNNVIAYEVAISLEQLLKKSGPNYPNLIFSWDIIFNIMNKLLQFPEVQSYKENASLSQSVHDFITAAEEKCPDPYKKQLYIIIESCSHIRNAESVIRLIAHQAEGIDPLDQNFVEKFNGLLEKYFKNDNRPTVQLEVLNIVRHIRQLRHNLVEDDAIDSYILQTLSHLDTVNDTSVRKAGFEVLLDIAQTCTNICFFFDILDIIEKVMKHMLENSNECNQNSNKSFLDVLTAVEGLINIFQKKLYILPSSYCVRIYSLLVKHIKMHYQRLHYLDEIVKIRKMVLAFLLRLRANQRKKLGILTEGAMEFSAYISSEASVSSESTVASPLPGSPSFFSSQAISCISYSSAFEALILCLKQEKNWDILDMIFTELPKLMQNRALIISGKCNIATLCSTLCSLINDRNFGLPSSLINAPSYINRTEVLARVFSCLSTLTSYHQSMESHIQRMLINCLHSGLVSRSANICMEGLTLCTLEMQYSMGKQLPSVLLKLSKISATVSVSVSVLEFLSNLIRLPHLYVSFVEDQYMSIFAIALPYTNPYKFNQYTTALAHHVIAMWFLKCRIPFRKDFAKFITKGLRSNLRIPRDESQVKNNESDKNSDKKEMQNDEIVTLHTELMETGLDLMSRFTFGMASNIPKRSPAAEFLLEKGQRNCWLVGNKIITITTSGCGTKSFKYGLCERCYSSCRDIMKTTESDDSESTLAESEISVNPTPDPGMFERKRHRSEFQRRNTTMSSELITSSKQTKDDLLINFGNFGPRESTVRRHTSYFPKSSFFGVEGDKALEGKEKDDKTYHLCSCWCTGWAEVHIRRPTGNTSWMMKIQNHLFLPSSPPDIPLSALSSLVLPQTEEIEETQDSESCTPPLLESESANLIESESKESSCEGAIDISCQKQPTVMRRTNSSPDMNTGWSNYEAFNKAKEKAFTEAALESEEEPLVFGENPTEKSIEQDSNIKNVPNPTSPKSSLKLSLSSSSHAASSTRTLSFAKDPSPTAPISTNVTEPQYPSASSSFRDRGHTISVMSPMRSENLLKKQPEVSRRSGMNPSFVFLQLFYNACCGPSPHKPLLLAHTESNNRALGVLDHIPPYDTHKIGIIYVGPDQKDEVSILSNVYGSARYSEFLRGLGKVVHLADVDPHTTYLGGLDNRGEDGQLALVWHDDVMQVVFHAATFMCNKASDPQRNEKKKHIGNDFVLIVYNESGEPYNLSTLKSQVTIAYVIIQPEDYRGNIVTVQHKNDELAKTFGHNTASIITDESLSVFVRQMALHANFNCLIASRRQQSGKYVHVSNWLERLRTIKRLRNKVEEEIRKNNESQGGFENVPNDTQFDDFTDYV